jgi:hypothetical protein
MSTPGMDIDGNTVILYRFDGATSASGEVNHANPGTYDLTVVGTKGSSNPLVATDSPTGNARDFSGRGYLASGAAGSAAGLLPLLQGQSHTLEFFIQGQSPGGYTSFGNPAFWIGGSPYWGSSAENVQFTLYNFPYGTDQNRLFQWYYMYGSGPSYGGMSALSADVALPETFYRHLAVVRSWNGSTFDCYTYLDAQLIDTSLAQAPPSGGANSLVAVGIPPLDSAAQWWIGKMSQFRLSAKARTAQEIATSAMQCLNGPQASGGAALGYTAAFAPAPANQGGTLTLTWSRAALVDIDPTQFTITQPAGLPAVTVTGVSTSGTGAAVLQLSGDMRRGGTYTVAVATGQARALNDGGGNSNTPVNFTVTAVPFVLLSATPLPPLPSTQLRVLFSKPVLMDATTHGALNLANYSITWSGGTLAISAAASAAADQVQLTTAADLAGVAYELVPNAAIHDLDGNGIT